MNMIKAFTLIELLASMAIIALIIAILLPALKNARDSTKNVVCASNMRSIGIGLHLYGNDSDGFFPPMVQPAAGLGHVLYNGAYWNDVGWTGIGTLYRGQYLSDPQVFFCPSAEWRNFETCGASVSEEYISWSDALATSQASPGAVNIFSPYDYLAWYANGSAFGVFSGDWLPIAKFRHNLNTGGSVGRVILMDLFSWAYPASPYGPANHSDRGLNVLYLDGHAEWSNEYYSYGAFIEDIGYDK